MLSKTLKAGLERYEIGPKIRALRQGKKLGLAQLGAHTGLSPGLLSKIERGKLFPTLPTLLRIALVFGVGLEHFFVDADERPVLAVVRKGERVRLPDRPDKTPSYFFESLNFSATERTSEAYLAEFVADSKPTEPHRHEGRELIYVIADALVVTVNGNEVVLEAGDALYFDSSVPHTYRAGGSSACTAIVVVTP